MAHSADTSKKLSLSLRETEVLAWAACGKTIADTSLCMALSEDTIKAHVKNAMRKLNAVTKTHATAIALSHGLIGLGPSPERVIPLTTLFGLNRRDDQKPETTVNKNVST